MTDNIIHHDRNSDNTAYYHLYSISSIYLTKDVTRILVHNLVLSCTDYTNCLLFHVADKYIRKLQHVQNFAVRIIVNIPLFVTYSPIIAMVPY